MTDQTRCPPAARYRFRGALLVAAGLLAAACTAPPAPNPENATPAAPTKPVTEPPTEPVKGTVTDLPAFEAFIGLGPTPAQFRARYPEVRLVLPGEIATKELRTDSSRYFAKLDSEGRIVGGRFM